MATPAQVANDMAAHATYWEKRDRGIERLCRDAAFLIREFLAGARIDGRTYYGLNLRLLNRARHDSGIKGYPDFDRARLALEQLRSEVAR